jgi:hypothetical protein
MNSPDCMTILFCDQIGDRVRAILAPVSLSCNPALPRIAGSALVTCSGAGLCGWPGFRNDYARPCSLQQALRRTVVPMPQT